MKTNIVKNWFVLSMTAIMLPMAASAQQPSLRWKLKSVETRWKESRLTGASFDKKVRETTSIVNVKVSKVKVEERFLLRFERGKMRNEKDTNYEAFLGELVFDSKAVLLSSLIDVLKCMNKVSTEDKEKKIFSEGGIEVTYFAEHGKQHLEIVFSDSDSTFVLWKNDVEMLINRLKSIR